MKKNCKMVETVGLHLEETVTKDVGRYLSETLPPFKGILKCHELVCAKGIPFLDVRKLTCLDCLPSVICSHFSLGTYICNVFFFLEICIHIITSMTVHASI
nr:unnamed protein product [Callosobruchus analis]